MDVKRDILRRIYVIYFLICAFGVAVISRAVYVQVVEGPGLRAKAETYTTAVRNIEAVRGNIYAANGSLLATSIPLYEVRMDPNTQALTDEIFFDRVDTLGECLSNLFNDHSPAEYARRLRQARADGQRYYLIKRNVKYTQLKKMRQFPLFRKGRFKGGFLYIQQNKRQRPFQVLAARTIGYARAGIKPVGLEGAYDHELSGVSGKRLMERIAGGVWMPISDENEIEPEDGSDVHTTIDINIQDVAENALLRQLVEQDADHGCVALMEVESGAVLAIANLSRGDDGTYYERYNYAIGESTEPGSTFKLGSYMAAIEDGYINPDDSIDAGDGKYKFYDTYMYDTKKGGYGVISFEQAFAYSSNIAVAKMAVEHYGKKPQDFLNKMYDFHLNDPLGIEIYGEGRPYVKTASDSSWSGISLPWISHGYEVQLTPLQILAYYNAVANGGKLVKPMFVREIRQRGQVVQRFEPEVIDEAICSKSTIKKVRRMLEAVVEYGTARNLRNANFKIAGKTGTAQIANAQYGYRYQSKTSYQASFAGYFPADNPKYSCIVVVNAPSKNVYYGNLVAGPIFKEIADKVYATSIDIHQELKEQPFLASTRIPVSKNGHAGDLINVFESLSIPTSVQTEAPWVITMTGTDKVEVQPRKVIASEVPNVLGMNAQDAIFLLENNGLVVRLNGRGTIKSQSVPAGTAVQKGQEIILGLAG